MHDIVFQYNLKKNLFLYSDTLRFWQIEKIKKKKKIYRKSIIIWKKICDRVGWLPCDLRYKIENFQMNEFYVCRTVSIECS